TASSRVALGAFWATPNTSRATIAAAARHATSGATMRRFIAPKRTSRRLGEALGGPCHPRGARPPGEEDGRARPPGRYYVSSRRTLSSSRRTLDETIPSRRHERPQPSSPGSSSFLPDGLTTYQSAPKALEPSPLVVPALVSPTYRYSGWPP